MDSHQNDAATLDLSSFPLLRIDQLDRHDLGTLEKSEEALSSLSDPSDGTNGGSLNAYAAKLVVGIRKEIASRRVQALLAGSGDADEAKLTQSTPLKRTPRRRQDSKKERTPTRGAFSTPGAGASPQSDGMSRASSLKGQQRQQSGHCTKVRDARIPVYSPGSWRSSKGASRGSRATHGTFVTVGSSGNRSFRDRAKSASLARRARSVEQSEEFKRKQVEKLRLSRRQLILERMELRRRRRRKAEEAKERRRLREREKKELEAERAEAELQRVAEEAKSNAVIRGKSTQEAVLEAAAAAASAIEKDLVVIGFSDSGEESLSDAYSASDEGSTALDGNIDDDGNERPLLLPDDGIDCGASAAASTNKESSTGEENNGDGSDLVSQQLQFLPASASGNTGESSDEGTDTTKGNSSSSDPVTSDEVVIPDSVAEGVDTNRSSECDDSSVDVSIMNYAPNDPPLSLRATCTPSSGESDTQCPSASARSGSSIQVIEPESSLATNQVIEAESSLAKDHAHPFFRVKTEEKPLRSYPFVSIFPQFWGLFTVFSRSRESEVQSPANSRKIAHAKSSQQQKECLRFQHNLASTFLQIMKDYSVVQDEFDDIPDSVLSKACFFRVASNRTDVSHIIVDALTDMEGIGMSAWRELPPGLGLGNCWNLLWSWAQPKVDVNSLLICQKVNRFSSTKGLTRKDLLKKNISRASSDSYTIMPLTFVLPQEYNAFVAAFLSIQRISGNTSANFWIMKPIGLSRGRGISVINDIANVSYSSPVVIQRYLMNPFLFMKYKFDLRLYVLVTSFHPLETFLYGEGFARFSSMPFSAKAELIHDERVHLTNSSIQQQYWGEMNSSHPVRLAGVDGGGNKVRLSWLWRRLEAQGVDTKMLRRRVEELCLKTLVCVEDDIPFQPNSFEVFGFDVMFDEQLKPWLVEVNASPALARETELDGEVKENMIKDTIALVDPPAFDRQALARICERRVSTAKAQHTTKQGLTDKDQLEQDLSDIFLGRLPRQYGEMPENAGNYKRLAPSKFYDRIRKSRDRL